LLSIQCAMKLLQKLISAKDGSGSIHLRPVQPEDLWHTYNLLQPPTDTVRCTTLRKVVSTSTTGSTTSSKIRTNLTIQVSKVDFDPEAMTVRISGPTVEESKFVRLGAYHTLTLELARDFSIKKECWDQIFLDRIEEACHPENTAEIAALVMQPGLAHLCVVTGSITVTKARIEVNIPKKRSYSNNHTKGLTKFYEAIYQAVLREIDFNQIKCLLCGSPGYVKDDFYQYILEQALRRDDRALVENKAKFVLCKTSSGHKHALEEMFSNPTIMERMIETKVAKEVAVLNRFMRIMDTHPDKAHYGLNHVLKANEELAIDSLLVVDELFRNADISTRKKYVQLVESVRENGGNVFIFSSMHVSGLQLLQVSGVAAILRYPLPDLEQWEVDAISSGDDDSDDGDDKDQLNTMEFLRIEDDTKYMSF